MMLPSPNPLSLLHGFLSYFPVSGREIYTDESVVVFVPIYNEEVEIVGTLDSIFSQNRVPNMLLLSENGSDDKTRDIIIEYLLKFSDTRSISYEFDGAMVEQCMVKGCRVLLVKHNEKTGKARSVNFARPLMVDMHRVISIDSDTRMSPSVVDAMMRSFYHLVRRKGKFEIHERCIVGGIVRSRKEPRSGVIGELIHMARCANHDMGQWMFRIGQNRTAGFVASGCGYAVAVENFVVPERTITEDMDFTWKMELSAESRSNLTLEEVKRIGFRLGRHSLASFIKRSGQKKVPIVMTSRVFYDKRAILYPITPGTIGGLRRQVDRWTYGFQQNLIIYNKDLFHNKRLAFVAIGTEIVGTWGSIVILSVPILMVVESLIGYGISLRTGLIVLVVNMAVFAGFIFPGALRRHRHFGSSRSGAVMRSARDTAVTILPAYMYRWLMAPVFLKNVMKAIVQMIRGDVGRWDGTWIRSTKKVNCETAE